MAKKEDQLKETIRKAITAEEAKAALVREKEERAKACLAELQPILEKYRCQILPQVIIQRGRVIDCSTQLVAEE